MDLAVEEATMGVLEALVIAEPSTTIERRREAYAESLALRTTITF
jgi:hypothetical protein